jgi:hypothetical protein
MLKEILGVVEKTNTRPLLIVFVALALSTFDKKGGPLADPMSWKSLVLPVLVFISYTLVWMWIEFVHRLNDRLADNDIASWGPLVGCSVLAFCIVLTFWYLANHPDHISFSLLGDPGFVRLAALYLLAAETIKIER